MSEEKKSRDVITYIVAGLAIVLFGLLIWLGVTRNSGEDVDPVDSTAVETIDTVIPVDTIVADSIPADTLVVMKK